PKKDDLATPGMSCNLRGRRRSVTVSGAAKDVCALVSSDIIDSRPDLDLCQSNQKASLGGAAMSSDPAGAPLKTEPSQSERRSVPRYSLIATAEIIEPISDVRISGRISEISRKGCYV